MRNKGSLYVGLMLLLLGALFLVVNVGSSLFPRLEILRIGRLWPFLVLWVGLAFYCPLLIWWERRYQIYGLTMPGTIILVNGLIFLYNSLSGDWNSWTYLWTLEPLSVGLGLLVLYWLSPTKPAGLLVAALIIGGASLAVFAILVSAMGGIVGGVLGAVLLVVLGLILVVRAIVRPTSRKA